MADSEAGRGARSGEPDEMLSRDVGDKKRSANKEPTYIAAGEEIVLGAALAAGEVHADAEDDGEVDADDDEVDRGQRAVGRGHFRSKKHANLPWRSRLWAGATLDETP